MEDLVFSYVPNIGVVTATRLDVVAAQNIHISRQGK